jgi:phosphoribosylformylglycinamidine cyclo-ligase
VDTGTWALPAVFEWLARKGDIERAELFRTFNCGVGMVAIVPAEAADAAVDILRSHGEDAWVAGRIEAGERSAVVE